MAKRTGITKKVRFEVFKRDSFTCQYCGHKSPDVLLVLDHIEPVSKNGTNDILNLITSCRDCNSGKSDRRLSDTAVIAKQRQQLEDLQERKEQIEMMFQWQKGLRNLDDDVITQLSDFWSEHVPWFSLNENGIKGLKRLKKKYEIGEIMQAIRIAAEQYLKYDNNEPTKESVEVAWKKVGGICRNKRLEKEQPHLQRLYYTRGILRNRLSYVNEPLALKMLQEAIDLDASLDSLEEHAKKVRNWTEWRTALEAYIDEQNQGYDSDDSEIEKG